MAKLSVRVENSPQGLLVTIAGDLTFDAADQLQVELNRLAAQRPQRLVIDLAQVGMISSLALGQFVSLNHSLTRRGGKMVLANAQSNVLEVFRVSRLDTILSLAASLADAWQVVSRTSV